MELNQGSITESDWKVPILEIKQHNCKNQMDERRNA